MAKDSGPNYVVTEEVRLSYAFLTEARATRNDDGSVGAEKFSCVLLIPKTTAAGKATYKAIRAAQQAVLAEKFGTRIPKVWKDTLHDGDKERDTDESPEYAGHWYMSISASKAHPPRVVDRQVRQIMDAGEVYSGMYAKVGMSGYWFDTQGGKGISFGLRTVQKVRDGDRLDGTRDASDDFEALEDEDAEDLI